MRLLDVPPKPPRWTGTRALAIRTDPLQCMWCGTVTQIEYTQPALMIHGGYGAADQITVRSCQCGAVRSADHQPVNPKCL